VKIPEVACKIEAYAAVNPSEDPDKVRHAVSKVILNADYEYKDGSIKATSRDLHSLSKIQEIIRSRRANKVYRRQMRYHKSEDTTWFYLNKQAAYVDVVAICDDAEESPMGPIKVILHSKNLDKVVDWLAPEPV
jgi:uncharacterized protein